MKADEIVIISGKGGTGKTSITASIIPYITDVVIVDCDVDAPDLDILIRPTIQSKTNYFGMKKAKIDKKTCINCKKCNEFCKFCAINFSQEVNEMKCEGCSSCTILCPVGAISMVDIKTGVIYESESKFGKMFHARLVPGEEASGKLIANLRKKSKDFASKNNSKKIIIDGPPGIGCNVISSIIGVNKAIIVTEPTVSAIHDLKRIHELLSKYPIKIMVVINKYTISLAKTIEIEKYCRENNISVELKVPFNKKIVEAISNLEIPSIIEKDFFNSIGFFKFIEKIKE